MRGWALLFFISFLMVGTMSRNGFPGKNLELPEDPSTMGESTEEEIVEPEEGHRARFGGYLRSKVTTFRPDLSKESVDGKEEFVEAEDFFPDYKDHSSAGFHFEYEKEEGVRVFASWYSVGYFLEPKMGEMEEDYYNGDLDEEAEWYMTLADLDKDGIPELLVALHDGVIDGTLKVFKMYNYEKDDPKQMTLREEEVGEIWFQNEVYIEKTGNIIVKIGSQGLYEEYAMKDGKLELIYSPSTF